MTRHLIGAGCIIALSLAILWYMNPNRDVDTLIYQSDSVKIIDVHQSISQNKSIVVRTLRSKNEIEGLRPILKCKLLGWTEMKRCACLGDARFEFYSGSVLIGNIGIQHNKAIRLMGISSDCDLVDEAQLLMSQYMKDSGVTQ